MGRSRAIESYFAYLRNLAGVSIMLKAVPAQSQGDGLDQEPEGLLAPGGRLGGGSHGWADACPDSQWQLSKAEETRLLAGVTQRGRSQKPRDGGRSAWRPCGGLTTWFGSREGVLFTTRPGKLGSGM